MSKASKSFRRAVAAHREAAGLLADARRRIEDVERAAGTDAGAPADDLGRIAADLAPGWFGVAWEDAAQARYPLGGAATAPAVRVGTAEPDGGTAFPALVPLSPAPGVAPAPGAGHLTLEGDARDPQVGALLRSVLVRLLAGLPPGRVRVLPVDGRTLGAPFVPLLPLVPAGLMSEVATDPPALRTLLEEAEAQVALHQRAGTAEEDDRTLVLAVAALPPGARQEDVARIAALAHVGAPARVHVILAGYGGAVDGPGALEGTAHLVAEGRGAALILPGGAGRVPVILDGPPPETLVTELGRHLVQRAGTEAGLRFDDLIPEDLWSYTSVEGVRTVVGRAGRTPHELALDDATPHWLIGGRTGSGKTVFLLDLLYGLAARYSPDELALYLLDFKEGVSFTEFVPTDVDGTWVPHARTVGVESDREYGVAVLEDLVREMQRRAVALKQAGATRLAQLRTARRDIALPRIVCVIDEFHVMLQGKDETAARATTLLEEVARKGRSYGIHLVLSSQTTSGVDALFGKGESILGQFPVRIALTGGGDVLAPMNHAAAGLPIGTAVVNTAAGAVGADLRVRFPDADPEAVAHLRRRLWDRRIPGSHPPAVFTGYAEYGIDDDPTFARLTPAVRRRTAWVGRAVDVGMPAAGIVLDAGPGRHLAVLGTSAQGADVLHAATVGLARQHHGGDARFVLAGLIAAADGVVDATAAALVEEGHTPELVDAEGLVTVLRALSDPGAAPAAPGTGATPSATYLVVFGADAASAALRRPYDGNRNGALEDLRRLLREGPARGIHLLGWWRGVAKLDEDLGPTSRREDVAGVLALNVRAADLGPFLGRYQLDWTPRANRALLVDRHDDTATLVVPFVRPGRYTPPSPYDSRERP